MNFLNIISADEGIRWTYEIERLNEETSALLKEIGITLQDVGNDADSEVVDTLVRWGGNIITSSNDIKKGLDEIAEAVRRVIKIITDTNENGRTGIRQIIDSIDGNLIKFPEPPRY